MGDPREMMERVRDERATVSGGSVVDELRETQQRFQAAAEKAAKEEKPLKPYRSRAERHAFWQRNVQIVLTAATFALVWVTRG